MIQIVLHWNRVISDLKYNNSMLCFQHMKVGSYYKSMKIFLIPLQNIITRKEKSLNLWENI